MFTRSFFFQEDADYSWLGDGDRRNGFTPAGNRLNGNNDDDRLDTPGDDSRNDRPTVNKDRRVDPPMTH
jgi:hypothetical protein